MKRLPPPAPIGLLPWLRSRLFDGPASSLATVLILLAAAWLLPGALRWAVSGAVWSADAEACRQAAGACWGMVAEKYRPILFGRYPYEAQWRPLCATALLLAAIVFSLLAPALTRRKPGLRLWPWLGAAWVLAPAGFLLLMGGGAFGLAAVPTELWGGLPLTLLLATAGIATAFPLALLVALGRSGPLPAVRALCAVYVETVRSIPLVPALFLASFLIPLLVPPRLSADVLLRVQVAITLFAAAYLAEAIRGALASVPDGQRQAAAALGLGWWGTQRHILLPQALRAAAPSIANSFVNLFKDTSLVVVVGLYELTGSLELALSGDPQWRSYHLEGYLFIGAIYWLGCYALSRASRRLEFSPRA
ncbi:ABC transporter permease subunit [Azoarcus indigens]|uniref:Amino acid ABC transporter membrane protein 2 (PAAT family) n=1 Tax=Azoarcus indigens TaxID=29545 RepID=A0A4R6EEW9_9RHOO|nr:amino acid ABC transporter permease [Azoarcus indigens]NMG67630.1 ABC transporter permease subunit [Azoarcus indigens]TDN56794.1 amino acid ABC transporter membrane protein 2 (PAAT family) [Azoarcus indigens]